jgi:hypothetical protein
MGHPAVGSPKRSKNQVLGSIPYKGYSIRDGRRVDFFVNIRGGAPVEEFLVGLPVQHKAKALALIKMLEREGPSLPFPYSSQVRGKLRELRTQQGKDKLRILYFGDANRVLVLLHGIVKRSAKLPEEDIRTAEARMELHNRRLEEKRK